MTTDDVALSAYLDGELRQEQADILTERIAREPELAARLEALRAGDNSTRELYAKLDQLPMPKAVLDLLQQKPAVSAKSNVVPFPRRVVQPFLQMPVAIAASVALVAGFLVHDVMQQSPTTDSELASIVSGRIEAGTEVHRLLESGLGTAPHVLANGATGRLRLTFEDRDGDFCRQFSLSTDARSAQAVACRRAGGWLMEVLDFGPAAGGEYQQASVMGSEAVNATVDALIGGNEPLDAEAEARLVGGGWKKITD